MFKIQIGDSTSLARRLVPALVALVVLVQTLTCGTKSFQASNSSITTSRFRARVAQGAFDDPLLRDDPLGDHYETIITILPTVRRRFASIPIQNPPNWDGTFLDLPSPSSTPHILHRVRIVTRVRPNPRPTRRAREREFKRHTTPLSRLPSSHRHRAFPHSLPSNTQEERGHSQLHSPLIILPSHTSPRPLSFLHPCSPPPAMDTHKPQIAPS